MLRGLRSVCFVVMLATFVFAFEGRLLASPCDSHPSNCTCDFDPFGWSWSETCDFSDNPDPQGAGAEFCDQQQGVCAQECQGGDFLNYAIQQCTRDSPPDCVGTCTSECLVRYEDFFCEPGITTQMSCSCNYFDWCAC